MGVERLVGLWEASGGTPVEQAPDVYMVAVGDAAMSRSFDIAERLRDRMPGLKVELNMGGGSFKSQLKRADRSGAAYAVILGEDEVARNEAGLKPLRDREHQVNVNIEELADTIAARFGN